MNRTMRWIALTAAAAAVVTIGLSTWGIPPAHSQDSDGRDIPAPLAPFEYLVGRWKGSATPKNSAQSFRGWQETHAWAWIFEKGKPTGLSVSIEGGKILASGKLTYDAARKIYRLEAVEPKPKAGTLLLEGKLDATGKRLVLDQQHPERGSSRAAGADTVRVWIRPNSNFIRYTMMVERKEPGDVQFGPETEIGLTKEGESLAGGTSASDRPKCIVTGGAATMTLTYNGQTFPICCTGCRDEFNENPEKYIKKASLIAQSRTAKKADGPAPSRVGRFEDAFAGDVVDAPLMKRAGTSARGQSRAAVAKSSTADDDGDDDKTPAPSTRAKAKGGDTKGSSSAAATRAAGLVRLGQALEKSGKNDVALEYYRRVVKDFAGTPAAKTAAQRIKALDKKSE